MCRESKYVYTGLAQLFYHILFKTLKVLV